jgi:hypothetical protein
MNNRFVKTQALLRLVFGRGARALLFRAKNAQLHEKTSLRRSEDKLCLIVPVPSTARGLGLSELDQDRGLRTDGQDHQQQRGHMRTPVDPGMKDGLRPVIWMS